jgi:hypothetical protein
MEDNGTPPECYLVSVKENGSTIKKYFSKKKKVAIVKQEIEVIKIVDIPIKRKTKKEFKDEVL